MDVANNLFTFEGITDILEYILFYKNVSLAKIIIHMTNYMIPTIIFLFRMILIHIGLFSDYGDFSCIILI